MGKAHSVWHVVGGGGHLGNSKCKGWEVRRGLASLKNEPQMRGELKEEGEVSERLEIQTGSDPARSPGHRQEFRFYSKGDGKPFKRTKWEDDVV